MVPFTSGSGSDIIARIVGPKLSERWNQGVVVDNKPGASGNIGAAFAAKAAPDGHTLLMAINTLTMAPAMYKKVPFDPVADFAPVSQLAVAGFTFVVHPGVQANDMASLQSLLRSRPEKLNYGSPGNGTPHHLAMELMKQRLKLDAVHVPYKGLSGAMTDLIGGRVEMMFATVHSVLPHVQAGKLKLLAVTGEKRSELAPAVATFREQGIDFMDQVDAWYAVFAPARTPAGLVAKLQQDFHAVVAQPEVRELLARQGLRVRTGTPEELGALVRRDYAIWRKLIGEAGISAD